MTHIFDESNFYPWKFHIRCMLCLEALLSHINRPNAVLVKENDDWVKKEAKAILGVMNTEQIELIITKSNVNRMMIELEKKIQ